MAMPMPPPPPHKLRASCDECGAAKLKCDRARPACGRCAAQGFECVYGVSRKTAKSRRSRTGRPGDPPPPGGGSSASASSGSTSASMAGSGAEPGALINSFSHSSMPCNTAQSLPLTNPPASAPQVVPGDNRLGMQFDPTGLDDVLDTSLLSGEATSGWGDGNAFAPALGSTTWDPWNFADASGNGTSPGPASTSSGHDCFPEGLEILSKLSKQAFVDAHASPSSRTISTSSSRQSTPQPQMPVDHILKSGREATQKLQSLLACSCAGAPQLSLLYSGIILRILLWYHQAVRCTQTTQTASTAPEHGSLGRTASGPDLTSPMSSNNSHGPLVRSASGGQAVPPDMAVGSFNVDDYRVQAAVHVQLLYGEIRRIGHIIDQFASRENEEAPCPHEDETLRQNLDVWLKRKHSILAAVARSKLRELNP